MCVKARDVHSRVVRISAPESESCQTVQHFPTLSFRQYSNFSLLILAHPKPCAVPGEKVFLMTTYCK